MLTPKAKRNISRIIPFGIIWLLGGWIADIVKIGEAQGQTPHPDADISFTIPVLIFARLANLLDIIMCIVILSTKHQPNN